MIDDFTGKGVSINSVRISVLTNQFTQALMMLNLCLSIFQGSKAFAKVNIHPSPDEPAGAINDCVFIWNKHKLSLPFLLVGIRGIA